MRRFLDVLRSPRPALGLAAVGLVVVLGVVAASVAAAHERAEERERAEGLLAERSADIADRIEREVERYEELVSATAGLAQAAPDLTRSAFDTYLAGVHLAEGYPGAAAVGFVLPVDEAEEALRRLDAGDGPVDLAMTPAADPAHLLVTAARRADGDPPTLGVDLADASEPATALMEARDTGEPVLSAAYVFPRDRGLPADQRQRSFLLVAPVYSRPTTQAPRAAALRGWVFAGFRGEDLMRDLLRTNGRDLDVELYDGAGTLVAATSDGVPVRQVEGWEPEWTRTETLVAAGQRWRLQLRPREGFFLAVDAQAGRLVLLTGLVATALLALGTAMLASGRQRALRIVHRSTASLKAAKADLEARQEFTDALLETIDVGIITTDQRGRLTYFNRLTRELHGLDMDSEAPPETWAEHYSMYEADGETPLAQEDIPLVRILREGEVHRAEVVIVPHHKPRRILMVHGRSLRRADGELLGAVCAAHDITALRDGEEALRRSEDRFRTVFARGLVGMALANARGAFIEVNGAFCDMFGMTKQQLFGRSSADLTVPKDRDLDAEIAHMVAAGVPVHQVEQRFRHAGGETVVGLVSATAVPGPAGERLVLYQVADITERKVREAKLVHQALHDGLTGLPNRALLMDRLENAVARHRRHGQTLAVMVVDLDGFQGINQSVGHEAGDVVLVEMGRRLGATVRAGDTVARMDSDEFVVLFDDLGAGEAEQIAERVQTAVAQPVQYQGHGLTLTASAGLVFAGLQHESAADLLHDAAAATYRAKAGGKQRIEVSGSQPHALRSPEP